MHVRTDSRNSQMGFQLRNWAKAHSYCRSAFQTRTDTSLPTDIHINTRGLSILSLPAACLLGLEGGVTYSDTMGEILPSH